jgi:hypothetical protein
MEEDKTDAAGGRSADRFSLLWIHMIGVDPLFPQVVGA